MLFYRMFTMMKFAYFMLIALLTLQGCERSAEELSAPATTTQLRQSVDTSSDGTSTGNEDSVSEPHPAKDTLFMVNEDHLAEAQHTLVSRIQVLIQDAQTLQTKGVYITEYTRDDQPIIPAEERYLAFQDGFRAGVVRGINKPVVSAYFPRTLPSKAQQQHWQKGQSAGHAYGVYLLKDYLAERYGYEFEYR